MSETFATKDLAEASRDRSIKDLIVYPKTRKIILIWTIFNAVVLILAVRASEGVLVPLFGIVSGIMIYSLIEYLVHRYCYHHEPDSKILRFLTNDAARGHTKHHENPSAYGGGINGNQMPILGFAVVVTIAALLSPFPSSWELFAISAGTICYALQELIHFGCHHLPMRGRLLGALKRHHMLHHYRDDHMNYGILWAVWDMWFGTHFDRDAKRKSV